MVFIMVVAHAAIAFWHHFHLRSTESMDLETFPQLATPNHRKSQNCAQSMLQEGPQIQSKLLKTDIWASVCPLVFPLHPRMRLIATINLSTATCCQEDSFPAISNPPVCNEQMSDRLRVDAQRENLVVVTE